MEQDEGKGGELVRIDQRIGARSLGLVIRDANDLPPENWSKWNERIR